MEYEGHTVPMLEEFLKERGVRGYSKKRRGEFLEMLQASEPQPAPPPTWEQTRSQIPDPRSSSCSPGASCGINEENQMAGKETPKFKKTKFKRSRIIRTP